MDERVEDLTYGIKQGDDAIVIGDTIVNMEGPYPMKIGRKTGLIHTCSDIVVMGGRPLFALNSMQVESMKEAEEETSRLLNQCGLFLKARAEFTEAKEVLERALASAEKSFEPGHPSIAIRQSNLALVLQDLGELEEARELARLAYEAFLEKFGPQHPNTKITKQNWESIKTEGSNLHS